MVIYRAHYVIVTGEHTALNKISQTYKYTLIHKPKKIITLTYLAHHKHTHTHTHTNMQESRERNATGMRGGEGGQERKKTEFEISCCSTVCRGSMILVIT